MAALIFISGITGGLLILMVKFIGPDPEVMIPVAAAGIIVLVSKAVSLYKNTRTRDRSELRRLLQEEVSDIGRPPSKSRLEESAARIGIKLEKYFDDYANGSLLSQGLRALLEKDYKNAVELFGENANTELKEAAISWFLEGNARFFLEEYKEAVIAYQKCTSFNPRLARAWHNWGMTLEALGRNENATEKYQKALERDPGLAETGNEHDGKAEDSSQPVMEILRPRLQALEPDAVLPEIGILHQADKNSLFNRYLLYR